MTAVVCHSLSAFDSWSLILQEIQNSHRKEIVDWHNFQIIQLESANVEKLSYVCYKNKVLFQKVIIVLIRSWNFGTKSLSKELIVNCEYVEKLSYVCYKNKVLFQKVIIVLIRSWNFGTKSLSKELIVNCEFLVLILSPDWSKNKRT